MNEHCTKNCKVKETCKLSEANTEQCKLGDDTEYQEQPVRICGMYWNEIQDLQQRKY